jgi:K+-transporting ATPase c subunit
MIKHLRPAIMLTVLMTALTGLAYPLAMTGVAGRLFPHQANGSLIERNHRIGTDWAEFHERRLFSWAAVRHDGHRSKRFDQDRAGAL